MVCFIKTLVFQATSVHLNTAIGSSGGDPTPRLCVRAVVCAHMCAIGCARERVRSGACARVCDRVQASARAQPSPTMRALKSYCGVHTIGVHLPSHIVKLILGVTCVPSDIGFTRIGGTRVTPSICFLIPGGTRVTLSIATPIVRVALT